jgi:hypothetical protein
MNALETPFRPSDIPLGLVGYWKFAETSGTDASDSSGKGYTLTGVNTPVFELGDYWKTGGYSTKLTAASSMHYTLADNADLQLLGNFSISAWIKKAASATAYVLLDKNGDGGEGGYRVTLDASNNIFLKINGTTVVTTTAANVLGGKWQHIAVTYDGVTARIYIDGNLSLSVATTTENTSTSGTFYVGADDGSTNPFGGNIKDLAIWNHGAGAVLTPSQIKSLALGVDLDAYAYRPSDVSTQPTHWWKLNDPIGATCADSGTSPLVATKTGWVENAYSGGYIEGAGVGFAAADTEHLEVADNADWEFGAGDFTCALWVKAASLPTSADYICRQGTQFRFGANASQICWFVEGSEVWARTDHGMVAGVWYHLVCRRSGNSFKVFKDGVALGSEGTATPTVSATGNLYIGDNSGGSTEFDGVMSDIAIWKGYALTDAEIASLACGLPIQRQGIVSYWKMDEASGTRADSIGVLPLLQYSGTVESGTGKVGNAADFEAGDTEYLNCAHAVSATMDILSDMAILGWLKPESIDITGTVISHNLEGTGYGITQSADEKINFYIANDTDVSTTLAVAGTWMHFCGNYDGALKAMWVNGVLEGNGAFTTNPSNVAHGLAVGMGTGSTDYFDGLIDELILAKRYFRPEEIKAVYLKGLNGKSAISSEKAPAAGYESGQFFSLL